MKRQDPKAPLMTPFTNKNQEKVDPVTHPSLAREEWGKKRGGGGGKEGNGIADVSITPLMLWAFNALKIS